MMKKLFLMLAMLVASVATAMAQDVYVVAGCAELCGSTWDPGDTDNQMVLMPKPLPMWLLAPTIPLKW